MNKNGKTGPTLSELIGTAFGKMVAEDGFFSYARLDELHGFLKLCVTQRSMSMISGKAGIGKTTGVRSFTVGLPSNKYLVLYFGQDQDGKNLLRRFAQAFGLKPKFRRSDLALQVSEAASDCAREGGKEIVAVIDEAHLLDDRTLEDIRLLTNNDFDTMSPISIILLGQQQLRLRLKSPGFEALDQRLRYRYFLEGFTLEETRTYIKHRLTAAGGSSDIFTDEAIARVFDASEGVPREINNLCALALLKAENLGLDKVDEKLVKQLISQRELS